MSIAGRSFIVLLFGTFLFSCHSSNQFSTDSQTNKELEKILNDFSRIQAFSKLLKIPPPSQGKLSTEHMEMYAWVSARSLQFYLQQQDSKNTATPMLTGYSDNTGIEIKPEKQESNNSASQYSDYDISISAGELAALKELGLNQEVYAWVKTTYQLTVDFINKTGESEVLELAKFYDPVLKHNINLVNEYKDKLIFSGTLQNRYRKPQNILNANFGSKTVAISRVATR